MLLINMKKFFLFLTIVSRVKLLYASYRTACMRTQNRKTIFRKHFQFPGAKDLKLTLLFTLLSVPNIAVSEWKPVVILNNFVRFSIFLIARSSLSNSLGVLSVTKKGGW